MAKRIASAQTTVGEFTRETEVQYTHVVVRRSTRAAAVLAQFERGEYKGKRSGIDARWIKDRGFVVSWHNSEAAAKAASTKAYPYDARAELVGIFAAGTKRDEPAPAPAADAGEWVPVDADEAARIEAEEAAACRAAGPTALHALVADQVPAKKLTGNETLIEELDIVGDVRDGHAVLTRDVEGFHMRDSRNLFGKFRHDLPADTDPARLEAHWTGFAANVREHYSK